MMLLYKSNMFYFSFSLIIAWLQYYNVSALNLFLFTSKGTFTFFN